MATELRALIGLVKDYDHESRELQSTLRVLQNTYDEKTEDLGGQKHVVRIKEAISEIKKTLSKWKVNEGLMVNTLFHKKPEGKNFLYDIPVGDSTENKDFTADDLTTPTKKQE